MTKKTQAEIALLCTTVIWGGTFIAVKMSILEISALTLIAVRFSVGSLFYGVFFARQIFPLSKTQIRNGAVLGLLLFGGFVAQNVGLQYTSASTSAFITGMMVVFVPMLQIIVEKKAPMLGSVIGVFIAVAGLWLLTSPETSGFGIGELLTLLCAVIFAGYIIHLDIVSHHMNALQLTFLQIFSCAVYGWIGVFFTGGFTLAWSANSIGALAYLTFLATILTTYVQTRYQKDTTPTRAVLIFTIEPIITAVAASWILGEYLGTAGIIGGAVILVGVLLSELSDGIRGLNIPVGGRK